VQNAEKNPEIGTLHPHMLHILLPAVGDRPGRFFARKPHMQNFSLQVRARTYASIFPQLRPKPAKICPICTNHMAVATL
jgi:hypothetical protein